MSATGRGKAREANDNYPTPAWLTRAIIPVIRDRFPQGPVTILEPACGEGAIVKVLEEAFPNSQISSGDITEGYDFLTREPRPLFDLVITNPPYLLAQEFVNRARLWQREPCAGRVPMIVMLMRLNFLGSRKRAKWLRADRPSFYVSPRRPSFGTNKNGQRGTDATEYAWFIWQAGTAPTYEILPTEDTLTNRTVGNPHPPQVERAPLRGCKRTAPIRAQGEKHGIRTENEQRCVIPKRSQ